MSIKTIELLEEMKAKVAVHRSFHFPFSKPEHLAGKDNEAECIWKHLSGFARKKGITIALKPCIAMQPRINGMYVRFDNYILVKESLPLMERARVLAHELGHAILHWDRHSKLNISIREVEAESIAYIVMNHFGIDTSEYSSKYLALWLSNFELPDVYSTSQGRITVASQEIITFQ